ncbi:hypothetical protein LCGC14_1628720 [marine sediment metagenome]|uniref:Pectinesterase catalytic domain-containing protein n=1 Tax=marine sediment metagenome TaxID=412755 RepID=A0A0F9I3C2_9ZZZZ
MVSPVPGVTAFARRRNLRSSTGVPTSAPVDWRNVVIVDLDGGGDFLGVQDAIDSITTESNINPFIVYLMLGEHVETTLTMKSWVTVVGISSGKSNLNFGSSIKVTSSASGGIVEANNSGFENVLFRGTSSSFSSRVFDIDTNVTEWFMTNCRVGFGTSRLGAGIYENCSWNGTVDLNGASNLRLPFLNNNLFTVTASNSLTSDATADYGHITGGSVWATPNITESQITLGQKIVCTGVDFVVDRDGLSTRDWNFVCRGMFAGCSFSVYDEAATGVSVIDPTEGSYAGCTFNGIQMRATPNAGPILISGSIFNMLLHGNNNACLNVNGTAFPVVVSGSVLRGETATSTIITGVANSLLELNGNTYLGTIAASSMRLRGTDVRSEFFPVNSAAGTGAIVARGLHPAMELNTAAEVAFIVARIAPPADVLNILDARLVVSGEFDKANDSMTGGPEALAAHTSDTGEAWTLVSGTATVSGGTVTGSSAGIHTWGAAGAHGFLQVAQTHDGSANRVQSFIFRYSDTSNYWRIELRERATSANIDVRLIKKVASSDTVVASIHVGGGTYTGIVGVSFLGDDIKVYIDTGMEDNGLAIETNDSFNNTATVVGLQFSGGGTTFDDLDFWRGDNTLDLTVDADFGQESSPLDELTDSLTLTNQPIAHHAFSYIDVIDALDGIKQGSILGLRITLDALGTVHTALNVHGLLIRTLPTSKPLRTAQVASDGTESQQVTYR